MGEKVYIQDIINLLAEQQGMSKKDAETFIKTMFNLVKEVLETEKFVKIKGLGTFKLIDVDSRESIDVNTGERFTIKGYTKISFTPDPAIRELINKPFAHFETIVLNENTALEDTPVFETENNDSEAEEAETIPSEIINEEKQESPASETEEDDIIELEESKEVVSETIQEDETDNIIQDPLDEEPGMTEESIHEAVIIADQEELEENKDTKEFDEKEEQLPLSAAVVTPVPEEPVKNKKEKSKKDKKKKKAKDATQPVSPEIQTIAIEKSARVEAIEKKMNMSYFIGIVFVTLLLICGIIFFIYRPDLIETLFLRPQSKSTTLVPNPLLKEPASNELTTTLDEQSLLNEEPKLDDGTSLHKQPTQEELNSVTEEKRPRIDISANEQQPVTSSPEKQVVANVESVNSETIITGVRKGHDNIIADSTSYVIVGTMTTHKLELGETLTMVSRRFYETKDLWPYLVMHNRNIITDPNRVPAGTVIRIPALRNK